MIVPASGHTCTGVWQLLPRLVLSPQTPTSSSAGLGVHMAPEQP